MEIHSSSLNFSRVGFKRPQVDKNESAQKKGLSNELSVSKESHTRNFDQPPAPVSSSKEIKQRLDHPGLNSPAYNYKPTDVRTLKALNAYSIASNQPVQDQLSGLIAGIDIFA